MERLANSYDLVFMERSTMSQALTSPRSTGVRLQGTAAGERMNWSVGWYNGWLTNGLSFSESGNIVNARIAGLPIDSQGGRRLLHLGAWGVYAEPQEGRLTPAAVRRSTRRLSSSTRVRFRRRHSRLLGVEFGAVEGPVTLAAEYTTFRGRRPSGPGIRISRVYYVQASWAITGETRPYDHVCGCFGSSSRSRSLSFRHGGAGAFEVGARYSNIDLTSGAVDGGKFDRWSGAFSWFPTGEFRLEFNYGYGTAAALRPRRPDALLPASAAVGNMKPAASRRPAENAGRLPEVYFSISSLRPSAAILMLAPFVSLFRLITTPLVFRSDETPAPLPSGSLGSRRPRRHR